MYLEFFCIISKEIDILHKKHFFFFFTGKKRNKCESKCPEKLCLSVEGTQ